jgi:plastocyanin
MKLALALFLIILIAGCTAVKQGTPVIGGTEYQPNGNPAASSQTPAAPSSAEIRIMNFAFEPSSATIKQGGTVTWINEDSAAHTVVADTFRSQSLSKGQSFSHTFSNVGTFSYQCSIHPSMTGTVTVVAN